MNASAIKALIDLRYPNNSTGLITPTGERETLKAIVDFVNTQLGIVDVERVINPGTLILSSPTAGTLSGAEWGTDIGEFEYSGPVTLTANHATLERIDLIVGMSGDTVQVVTGTASENPVFPPIPMGGVLLQTILRNAGSGSVVNPSTSQSLAYSTKFKAGGMGEYALIWETDIDANQSYLFQLWYLAFTSDYFDENGQRPMNGVLKVAFAAKPSAAELDLTKCSITTSDKYGETGDFILQDEGSGKVRLYIKKTAWNQYAQFQYSGRFSTVTPGMLVNGSTYAAIPSSSIRKESIPEESTADFSGRKFYKNAKDITYTRGEKDIIINDGGDIIVTPSFMGNLVFTKPFNLRGVVDALGDKEFTIENSSGEPGTIEANYVGGPANSAFNIPETITVQNGEKLTFKSQDGKWVVSQNSGEVAWSDHLDSVGAIRSVGPDGLEVISGKDKFTGEDVTFKEFTGTPPIVDGIVFLQHGDKYFQRSFTKGISPRWFNAKGNGVSDDTASIQNTFLVASVAKLPVEFDESVYAVSTVDFKGCNVKFSNTKIKRLLSDVTTCELTGGEKIEGKLIVDGGGINATADLVTVRGKVSVDELEIINNGNVTGFYQDVTLLGSGVDFYCNRFYSKDGAYSGCSVHVGAQVDQIYINDYHCDNPKQKGFRVNGDVNNIYINNYYSIYRGTETSGTDGILVDGGVGEEKTQRVKVLQINNFYSEGFAANGAKIQSTDTFICKNFVTNSSANTTYAIQLLTKNCQIDNLKIEGHTTAIIGVFSSQILRIGHYTVSTTAALHAGKFNSVFEGDHFVDIGTLDMTGSTIDSGFFRTEYDGTKNAYIHIGRFISANQRPINNQGLPANKAGCIKIGELVGYTGSNYTGVSGNNNCVQIQSRKFTLGDIPSSGYHFVRDEIEFINPDSEGYKGAVCVSSGNPGIWKKFGRLDGKVNASVITSDFDLSTSPTESFYLYNTNAANFIGSPNDSDDWFINRVTGASHTVAIETAISRTTGQLYTRYYSTGAWGGWVSGFQLDANGNAVIANTKKVGNGVADSDNWIQYGNGATIYNVPTGQQHIFRQNGVAVAGISGDGKFFVEGAGKGIILKSPDGTQYEITVPDGGGSLTVTEI